MKGLILFYFTIAASISASAQLTKEDRRKVFKLSEDATLQEVNLAGGAAKAPAANQDGGDRFRVVKAVGNNYIIKFLEWRNDDTKNANFYNSGNGRKYFELPIADFDELTDEVIPRYTFTFGTMILPVKIRFGSSKPVSINPDISQKRDFDFSSDVNLGFMAGGKYRVSEGFRVIFPVIGFNIGTVAVDSTSTNGYQKTKSNLASITPYTGIIFEHDNIQLGLFTGIDFIGGKAGYNWEYRNQPWLGIGLGYSIFTAEANKNKQKK